MTGTVTAVNRVEARALREFGLAVRATEGDAAAPTFGVAVSAPLVERLLAEITGLDRTRLLHGAQSFEYFGEIVPEMVLRSTGRIVSDGNVAGRRGGTMRRIEIRIEHVDEPTGHLVLRETMVVMEVGAP